MRDLVGDTTVTTSHDQSQLPTHGGDASVRHRTKPVAHRHVPYCAIKVLSCPHCLHPGACQTRRAERASRCIETVDRQSGPRRTLLRWHRRRVRSNFQDEPPRRIGSARESGVVNRCTSQQRSTAASSAAPSIQSGTSVCATRRVAHLRARYRCCASSDSIFPRRPSTPRRSCRSSVKHAKTSLRGCRVSPAEARVPRCSEASQVDCVESASHA
jgi:hypothetical protein